MKTFKKMFCDGANSAIKITCNSSEIKHFYDYRTDIQISLTNNIAQNTITLSRSQCQNERPQPQKD